MAAPPIGARVGRDMTLDEASIRAGATLVGDHNPLHHDTAFAERSRFGSLIASGAHTAGLLAGLPSKGFGHGDAGFYVGVDYVTRFLAPVRAGHPLRLQWVVIAHEVRRSGTLARLEGRILDLTDGATMLSATMSILYLD